MNTVLNWSSYVVSDLICTILMAIVALTCLTYYFRTKYPHQLYLGLVWVWATIANFFWTFSNLYLSKTLLIFDMICIPIEIFFTIVLGDYILRDSIDPWKILPFAMISGAFLLTAIDPSNYRIGQYPNGEWTLFYSDSITGTLFTILSTFWMIIFFNIFGRIAFNSPSYLKKKAWLNVLSMLIIATRGILFDKLNAISPFLNVPLLIIGVTLQVYTFVKYPELAFTQAKKVFKLYVIDSKSGLHVFHYDWLDLNKTEKKDQSRYTGLVFGLNLNLEDAFKRGNVDKIEFERGILLLERVPNSSWMVVLIATKTQLLLSRSLKLFAERFSQEFGNLQELIIEVEHYKSANSIIEECFPFAPKFIQVETNT